MRISELAARSGVSAHRLRRYEALGLIRGTRTAGGYRDFAEATLREVTFIAMARELGFALPRLAELLPRYRARTLSIDEMVDGLRRRIAEIDSEIAERRALRKRLVDHIAWFDDRRRRAAARRRDDQPGRPAWPGTKKEPR